MQYFIEPVDNFFFRSSVPFEMGGETTVVEGRFPPLPSVYAGAFRKMNNGVEHLKIGFNGLHLNEDFCFAAPLDLDLKRRTEDGGLCFGRMKLKRKPLSNYPLDYIAYRDETLKKDKARYNPYLKEAAMKEYLEQTTGEILGVDLDRRYLAVDRKIGIEIDSISKTSREQQLYQTACIRPKEGLKLTVEANVELDCSTLIKLGGEAKTAKLYPAENELALDIEPEDSRYFKLYLATPAIFKNGWFPGWIDPADEMIGYFKVKKREIRVRLISACVGRSVPCGGFGYDGKEGWSKPRELRYAVPAGSVYYFKILNGSFEDAVKLFHKKCISDYRETMGFQHLEESKCFPVFDRMRYCDRGFGYALVGKCGFNQ